MKCDLHIHSIYSDGENSPEEIMKMAKEAGLDVISITDHNNIDSADKCLSLEKDFNILCIPGVELSTRYKGERIHILGYFSIDDYKNELLKEVLKLIRDKEVYKINEVLSGKIKIRKGKKRLSIKEGIAILRYFKGTVILAHPVKIKRKYLNDILLNDFDGIEGIRFENDSYDDIFFKCLGEENGYIITGGSDFHSLNNKSHASLGEVYFEVSDIYGFLKLIKS